MTVLPIVILPASSDFRFLTQFLNNGEVGTPYCDTWLVENAAGAVSFGASGLPAGLAVDPATGVVSGTPTLAGMFLVLLSASDGANTLTTNLMISIAPNASSTLHWNYFGIPAGLVERELRPPAPDPRGRRRRRRHHLLVARPPPRHQLRRRLGGALGHAARDRRVPDDLDRHRHGQRRDADPLAALPRAAAGRRRRQPDPGELLGLQGVREDAASPGATPGGLGPLQRRPPRREPLRPRERHPAAPARLAHPPARPGLAHRQDREGLRLEERPRASSRPSR